jgi:hypothetical protein
MAFVSDPHNNSLVQSLLPPENDRIRVYHACSWHSASHIEQSIVLQPASSKGKPLDFGAGFYVTRDFGYARHWALMSMNPRISNQPCVMVFSLPRDYSSHVLTGREWRDVVLHYRQNIGLLSGEVSEAEILEGSVCMAASEVASCRRQPAELIAKQLCLKTLKAVRMLRLEGAVYFRNILKDR